MKNIFISSYLVIVYCILGFLTYGEHYYMFPICLLFTFIISFLVFKYQSQKNEYFKIGLILTIPLCLILFVPSIWFSDFSRTLMYILFVPLSVYLGYLYFKRNGIFIPIVSVIIIAFLSLIVFPNFFVYYHNSNATKDIIYNDISLVDANNKPVVLENDKVIVLDFWSTNCGICFKKFPSLEQTYERFKDNKNVKIIAVNVPIRGDSFAKTTKILDSLGYSFPKLYAKSFKEVENNLKFNTFPHLIIIKNDRILFDGLLVTPDESLFGSIEDEINKVLESN